MTARTSSHRLSKSRFVAGIQCHKLLWWRVHEPDAPELQPGIVMQDRFDQGAQVGELATRQFPGGVLIDFPYYEVEKKISATQDALSAGAPAIYEASFEANGVFVTVDVLERNSNGFRLIEVKSSSSQKPEHIPDAAVQKHVLTQSGIDVSSVEIMHLNKEYRYGDQGDLLKRTDVTAPVEVMIREVPGEIEKQHEVLKGELPEVAIGLHCFEPCACPFIDRCWPGDPNHISKLCYVGPKKVVEYMGEGIHTIDQIPPDRKLPDAARRQIKSINEDRLIVEPTLAAALEEFDCRLGFLDFETISLAVPVWPGMGPWHQAAAQFSYHQEKDGRGRTETDEDSGYDHFEFLAEGPGDARPVLAERMIEATQHAERVVTYSAFERTRIRSLQKSVPHLEAELKELEAKLLDLLPVVRNNVYHPDFRGSFSIKAVLTPLVPELTYDDLVIVDGLEASVEIARLLFVVSKMPPALIEKTRRDLLAYCKRDTWAMVRLVERLRGLAKRPAERMGTVGQRKTGHVASKHYLSLPKWPVCMVSGDDIDGEYPTTYIESWKDFHKVASYYEASQSEYIFRGQRNFEHSLTPTLVRGKGALDVQLEEKHLAMFRLASRGRKVLSPADKENRDLELWALGQHHGLRTPLLDWTSSPYVALFFSFAEPDPPTEEHEQNHSRVVFVLNKSKVEEYERRFEPKILYEPLGDYNNRLISQSGLFTYVPYGETIASRLKDAARAYAENDGVQGFDELERVTELSPDVIRKIHVPNEDRSECLKHLNSMNINHASLFPDLMGAARFCNMKLDVDGY